MTSPALSGIKMAVKLHHAGGHDQNYAFGTRFLIGLTNAPATKVTVKTNHLSNRLFKPPYFKSDHIRITGNLCGQCQHFPRNFRTFLNLVKRRP
jgi:hypothetical protein